MWGLLSQVFGNKQKEGEEHEDDLHHDEEDDDDDNDDEHHQKLPASSSAEEDASHEEIPILKKKKKKKSHTGDRPVKRKKVDGRDHDEPPTKKRPAMRGKSLLSDEEKRARALQMTQEQVLAAGDMVAQSLYAGPWPSPARSHHATADEQEDFMDSFSRHQSHMAMVGASVQQFCRDTVLPSMLQAVMDVPTGHHRKQTMKGCLIGSLVLLREVLVQNAPDIFGLQIIPESNAFSTRAMTTAIILQALSREGHATRRRFLAAAAAYDAGGQEFSTLLHPTTAPSATPAEDSFWLHARLHPLVRKRRNPGEVLVAEANSVHVTVLQSAEEKEIVSVPVAQAK